MDGQTPPQKADRWFARAVANARHLLFAGNALTLAQDRDNARLATLAAEAGYADQPHMNREIRDLCGTNPGRLFRDEKSAFALSDLFTAPGARRP